MSMLEGRENDLKLRNNNNTAVQQQYRVLKQLLLATVIIVLFLGSIISGLVSAQNMQAEPGFVSFWNARFSIQFPNGWNISEGLPNSVEFRPSGFIPEVIVNWGYPTPSWILDKSAWISNMTKQGIIVDRIDNTTTIANNTGLTISFTDNDLKYSIALVKVHNLALALIYVGHINDFSTYEDKANTMLSTLHITRSDYPIFQDNQCPYNTLFTNMDWWTGWHSSECLGEGGK
jgi:hypothetical protein